MGLVTKAETVTCNDDGGPSRKKVAKTESDTNGRHALRETLSLIGKLSAFAFVSIQTSEEDGWSLPPILSPLVALWRLWRLSF